jgi:hypothetical protein
MVTPSWRRTEEGKTVLLALRPGTPVPDAVTEGTLVLASLDEDGLDRTRHFGLVPASECRFALPAGDRPRWKVTVHRLGRPDETLSVETVDGILGYRAAPSPGEAHPVEWVEFTAQP